LTAPNEGRRRQGHRRLREEHEDLAQPSDASRRPLYRHVEEGRRTVLCARRPPERTRLSEAVRAAIGRRPRPGLSCRVGLQRPKARDRPPPPPLDREPTCPSCQIPARSSSWRPSRLDPPPGG